MDPQHAHPLVARRVVEYLTLGNLPEDHRERVEAYREIAANVAEARGLSKQQVDALLVDLEQDVGTDLREQGVPWDADLAVETPAGLGSLGDRADADTDAAAAAGGER